MQVIPVIDLLGGQVVRGVAGRRSEYRPVESILCDDAAPGTVARALRETFLSSDVYVADLDAIAGAEPAWDDYQQIAAAGMRLWVDAGVDSAERAAKLAGREFTGELPARIVLGLETVSDPGVLSEVAASLDLDRLVFSLDLKDGRPLSPSPRWPADPLDIAAVAWAADVRRMIVLDLARVGVGQGTGTGELCRAIRDRLGEVELIAGGGVRGPDDLAALAEKGVDAALVASALHDGHLTRERT